MRLKNHHLIVILVENPTVKMLKAHLMFITIIFTGNKDYNDRKQFRTANLINDHTGYPPNHLVRAQKFALHRS